MSRKKKSETKDLNYTKNDSFENLKTVQELALQRRGKDDELNPDISIYLKAEELKGKLCGLYCEKDKVQQNLNVMGSVKINGKELDIRVGEDIEIGNKDDRIT